VVVVPLTMSAYTLLQRNLLYTAITRSKRLVVLAGSREALAIAVRTAGTGRRYTAGPPPPAPERDQTLIVAPAAPAAATDRFPGARAGSHSRLSSPGDQRSHDAALANMVSSPAQGVGRPSAGRTSARLPASSGRA
jgi:hypothetical protein